MTEPSVQDMITLFAQLQLSQVLNNGRQIGLSTLTMASGLMQLCAAQMAMLSPGGASAILRAYADVIDAGPGNGPTQQEARARFNEVGRAFVATVEASRDFPQPQGRA
jgi:hypothetical protein